MHASLRQRVVVGATAAVLVGQGAGVALAAPAGAATAKTTRTSIATVHPVAGRAATLTAAVRPKASGGTVAFADHGRTLSQCGKRPVKAGKATCRVTLKVGSHPISARYSGKPGAYKASTGKATVRVTAAEPATPKAVTVVGGTGSCTTSTGALVAVDYVHWSGPVVRGCGTTLTTGRALLSAGGFSITNVQRFPGFICRLANPLFNSGTAYPTPAQDPCYNTPPASAYWSSWTAAKGANTWTYNPNGADSDKPVDDEVEAWTFGASSVSGTTGQPRFTPGQIRAGLPVTKAVAARRLNVSTTGAAKPDITSGTQYLVDQLSGGTHYAPFGSTDIGLTIDGALALAAAGSRDAALTDMTDYVAAHQNDFTGLSGEFAAYASGGAVAKVALLAEATGRNPRSFGGADMIKGLDDLRCTKSDASTCAAKGNYAYTSAVYGQALAIIAELRAGDASGAAAAITYLESLQKSGGGFPSLIGVASPAETDSTAMAAMALALAPGARARAAVAHALAWLAGQQLSAGGFPGAAGDSINSAAVSAQALRLDAETYGNQIDRAETFLAAAQNHDGGFDVAAGTDGSDLRASVQAVSGAVGIPFASVLDDLGAKAAGASGAGYLASQLVDGNHYVTSYQCGDQTCSYDDQGLTADGVFALIDAGGHDSAVSAMSTWLAGQVGAYADPTAQFGGPYSGALAKLALVAEATGDDPHSFGGTDLLKLLADDVCAASSKGSSACTAKGDFVSAYSTVSQALGVLALQASPRSADHLTATSPAVVRLHALQCADGGFTSTLISPGEACTSEVDTTGYAVQALAAVPGTDAWLGKAQHYLEGQQKSSGLYRGAGGDNSNSTANAAQALQTLVTALYSKTIDAPGPKTVTPITAWQSALHGLTALAVSNGGGFGLTTAATADLRASTQAVAAATQRSLLSVSGAAIASTPRDAATSGGSGGTSGSGSGGSSNGSGGSSAPHTPAGSATQIGVANTGVTTGSQLTLALLLLLVGAGLAYTGRRRVAAAVGRHRGR